MSKLHDALRCAAAEHSTVDLSDAELTYRLRRARGEVVAPPDPHYLTGAYYTCSDYARRQGWPPEAWRFVGRTKDIHGLRHGVKVLRLWAPRDYYDSQPDFWSELQRRAVIVLPDDADE